VSGLPKIAGTCPPRRDDEHMVIKAEIDRMIEKGSEYAFAAARSI
jgi:hypothetical protein